ncbi:helix-turn-helix transcriptional regulator [Lentzea sp. BCCO 10_0061]|uniref:Helix-turn-helix transcriptional regulator n=1 Tax=Lentzea sokolovensis TaxID=3095429 RepID=A0ABU4UWS6_9PSEU|nr:helix-turn-helix transcriptional regulator [Lentzea sp. BCCO 10_0061]MDX8143901.1 helix-turn-helix transcriptional regulator [Lentzea sp. BCCO 10_0061]
MPKRFSSVVGRSFGDGVRDAIQSTGMTQRQIAELLDWEEAKVSDLVRGKGGVTEVELAMLLGLCRVPAEDARYLLALFRESREKGFLVFPEDGIPDQVRSLIDQERLANKITMWSMNLIPGPLQVPGYVTALIERSARAKTINIPEVLAAKTARQAIFHHSRQFVFYIHEQALRLPVGSPGLMQDQLLHVLAMNNRNYITVRVVPVEFGAHAGLSGSFYHLSYEKYEPVVFTETENTSLFVEDKASLTTYTEVIKLLDHQALDAEESKGLITSILA